MIRPLLAADIAACQLLTHEAQTDLDRRIGETPTELTDEVAVRRHRRIAHLHQTDPDSAWVAEVDGAVVGVSLALVRDGMWFLSLLMVHPSHQGKGLGRDLLDAALTTATDRSWILSTVDPAALRRYQRAGFDLHPSYTARGPVDRSRIPAVQGIREGSYDDDRGLLDRVVKAVRGATMTPDIDYLAEGPVRFVVADDAAGHGFAFLRSGGVVWLGATTEDAARRLLWTSIAEAGDEVEVDWLGGNQQWATDVCLDARLGLKGGASLCLRGQPTMSPYLPSGALG
ncbi:MAG: family N-acetyltransferase [Frankiales bacterium]|nr:family N-acetyltransferase [Frankiales bacterium]